VIFLRQGDTVLTNDAWHATAELSVSSYEEAVSIIRNDLRLMNEQKKGFTSIAELRQIEVLLDTLESRIRNFHQLVPRPYNRRGMMNIGGTIFKTLFGTATTADILRLHQTIEQLETKDADIVHSLENQMTYIKSLDLSSRIEAQTIFNLSTVVKDFMIETNDRFYEITRDILWLNLTVHSKSKVYMAVGQLEFALLQLTQQVEELLAAVQHTLQGKLPVTLISPSVLHNIIRNVSFHLPEGYELVAAAVAKYPSVLLFYNSSDGRGHSQP